MIAQTLPLLMLVAAAATVNHETFKPMAGVDPNTVSCDPTGETSLLLPHFTDCNKFFMCAHGKEVEFNCAPGNVIFDFERQVCDWTTNTRCWLRDSIDGDVEGSGEEEFQGLPEEELSGSALLSDESSGNARPLSAVTAQVFSSILNCNRADDAARQVPYKGDCQRYWRCESGVPRVSYCSDGLFFNERTQQCDFEANSRCAEQTDEELRGEFIVYE